MCDEKKTSYYTSWTDHATAQLVSLPNHLVCLAAALAGAPPWKHLAGPYQKSCILHTVGMVVTGRKIQTLHKYVAKSVRNTGDWIH